MPLCRCATMPLCHSATLPLCHSATMPFCHYATLPLCSSATMPLCHFALITGLCNRILPIYMSDFIFWSNQTSVLKCKLYIVIHYNSMGNVKKSNLCMCVLCRQSSVNWVSGDQAESNVWTPSRSVHAHFHSWSCAILRTMHLILAYWYIWPWHAI